MINAREYVRAVLALREACARSGVYLTVGEGWNVALTVPSDRDSVSLALRFDTTGTLVWLWPSGDSAGPADRPGLVVTNIARWFYAREHGAAL